MTYYDLRIEPKGNLTWDDIRKRIEDAFKDVGLWENSDGSLVQFLHKD